MGRAQTITLKLATDRSLGMQKQAGGHCGAHACDTPATCGLQVWTGSNCGASMVRPHVTVSRGACVARPIK